VTEAVGLCVFKTY